MSWLATALRIGGNGALTFLIAIKFAPSDVAVFLVLLTINNTYWMADLGLSPLFSRLFAYGFGGATSESLIRDLQDVDGRGRGSGVPNWNTIRIIFDQQQIFFACIAVATFVIGGCMGTWILAPQIALLAKPSEAWLAWIIVLAASSILLGGKTYANFLLGADRIAIQKRFESLVNTGSAFCAIGCILIAPNLLLVSAVYFVSPIVGLLLNRRIAYDVYDGKLRHEESGSFRWDIARAMWPQAWRMSIGVLFGQIVLNFTSLIIVRSAEPASAAQFLFSLRLIRILDNFSVTPFAITLPRMARFHYEGKTQEFGALVTRGMLYSLPVLAVPGVLIAIWGQWGLTLIGSKVSLLGSPTWLTLVFAATVMRYGAIHLQIVTVQNRVLWHVANGVSGIFFIGGLILGLGVLAPAVAYAVAYLASALLFYGPYSMFYSYKLIDGTARKKDMLIAGFCFAFLIGASAIIAFRQ